MNKDNIFSKILGYVLVAAISSIATFGVLTYSGAMNKNKLDELSQIIDYYYIGDPDYSAMEDAAAAAMIEAMGDQWSYYIPASEYGAYEERMSNTYVGIGVTVSAAENGILIKAVEEGAPAKEAGILPGDVIVAIDGQPVVGVDINEAANWLRGEAETSVTITVLRETEQLNFTVTREVLQVAVAYGQMIEGNIGVVRIENFDERCAQDTIAVVESLIDQGAEALIFDLRFNPGGYRRELVPLLDYLLPEGTLFRGEFYSGEKLVEYSDADCLDMPMAVVVNEYTYSAAEFFAATLVEYDWAISGGNNTVGKSRFQYTIGMSDGSAAVISSGKYLTPNGVDLADIGGLRPQYPAEVTDEELAMIYYGILPLEEDPQIQAVAQELLNKIAEK